MSTRVLSAAAMTSLRSPVLYPELQGARVLVTGLTTARGFDIARSFADAGCRLVIHTAADTAEQTATIDTMLEMLAAGGGDVSALHEPLTSNDVGVRVAQSAALAFGGIDCVINLITAPAAAVDGDATIDDIETVVSSTLGPACLITRVTANRMRTTWVEGLILNVLATPEPTNDADATLHALLRAALAAMTRGEAQARSADGIRINAVAPASGLSLLDGPEMLSSEGDIAALALHLASTRGAALTGHVFDAAGLTKGRR
jgi:NAD(P)-dependent dehydrogenase (short-subunit alcohol dehydrogenase family)